MGIGDWAQSPIPMDGANSYYLNIFKLLYKSTKYNYFYCY